MKLAVVSFFAALLTAPLAAQAADAPQRFAVTLRATVADRLTYEVTRSEGECRIGREGSGGRQLTLRTIRPTRIEVRRGVTVAYRPSRVGARVTGRANLGAYSETRVCRAAPIRRLTADCESRVLRPRGVRARFSRPARGAIAFASGGRGDVAVCGLEQQYAGGWLHLARGGISERALLDGRARTVVARGSATKNIVLVNEPARKTRLRAVVRWTLTFRRLG
jgi:hypothetical protein